MTAAALSVGLTGGSASASTRGTGTTAAVARGNAPGRQRATARGNAATEADAGLVSAHSVSTPPRLGEVRPVIAYVANVGASGAGTVTPIKTPTDSAGTPINVGDDPSVIAITPNGNTAYVLNQDSDTVTPIHTATDTAGPAISVGSERPPSPLPRTGRPRTWPTRPTAR